MKRASKIKAVRSGGTLRTCAFVSLVASCVLAVPACAPDIDTSRAAVMRGTLGAETYSVLCDRIGANTFPEDLSGASVHAMCHAASDGTYSSTVDVAVLPPASAGAVDAAGNPVSLATQEAARAAGIGRMQALASHRLDLTAALDAVFPATLVPGLDLTNADPEKTCGTPGDASLAQQPLPHELAELLGRLTKLYDDGTLPQATEALGRLMTSFGASSDGQGALSHLDARQGYRPVPLDLGAIRPIVGYPQLRDLANTAVRILSADSDPYDPNPRFDAHGNRILVPGSAYAQFSSLLAAAHEELRTATADPAVAPLTVLTDSAGRNVPSRPRGDLEMMSAVLLQEDPSFGLPQMAPSYIVQRDPRGYASVALISGALPAPFVDTDGDGLADVDSSGHFVTSDGTVPPTPFLTYGGSAAPLRDAFGRALAADGMTPLYSTLDTRHAYTASLINDVAPLVNPDPAAAHETLMNALAGAYVLFGSRDGSAKTVKTYAPDPARGSAPVTLAYDAFHTDDAPVLDLVYALGQVLGDPTADPLLAYSKSVLQSDQTDIARFVGAALDSKAIADAHPEAKIPATSTLWDDVLDVAAQAAEEPGLLEDLLRSFTDPRALKLATSYGPYLQDLDQVTYDTTNLNGPAANLTTGDSSAPKTPVDRTAPLSGTNRSDFYRFLQLIHDTNGATACNKEGAILHAVNVGGSGINADICGGSVPLCQLDGTPFHECEIFKIDDIAKYYVDSIIGKATLYFRPDIVRNGIDIAGFNFGATTVDTIEESSGIGLDNNDVDGFWDAPSSTTFRPRPAFLDRLVFFDTANDSPNPGEPNYLTNHFLNDIEGEFYGTTVCPERVIPDPVPTAPDASPDGLVHGLRSCADGQWLQQRDKNTIFVWESFGFYDAMTPLITAFANHGREDLFLSLVEALYRHWGDASATASECALTPTSTCTRDGADSYEALLSGILGTDVVPALTALATNLVNATVATCTAVDASGACTASTSQPAVTVVANALQAMLDPNKAAAINLTDRHGVVTAPRNDGTTNPQVTPVYLLVDALDAMDAAFATYAAAHPSDSGRQALWRSARSQLVDTFLSVNGRGPGATFADPLLPEAAPEVIDVLRGQLLARCPSTYGGGSSACSWARSTLTQNLSNVTGGPLFAGSMDLGDALRSDASARQQLETLATYLVSGGSANQALDSLLTSGDDSLQVLQDDANLVPLLHVLAEAASASVVNPDGSIAQKSLSDAALALLARLTGRALDAKGVEVCASETDPEQVLIRALQNLVTPMPSSSAALTSAFATTGDAGADGGAASSQTQTPLEVLMDVIGDLNRVSPQTTGDLSPADYAAISAQVNDFLTNKTSGLEQFYAIVRQATDGT